MPRQIARIALAVLLTIAAGTPVSAVDIASDPMRPDTLRSVSARAAVPFRVNAIIVSDERRIAIVNGRRVGVGDVIGDATVVSISRAEVILDVDGETQSLRVNNGAGQ